MAFYRKVKVNDEVHEYHVGKHFVKIKGLKGNSNIKKTDFFSDRRGVDGELVVKEAISPGMIADYINSKKIRKISLKRYTPTCRCNKPTSEKKWRCDPFDAEIHEVYRYAMWCEECHEERSWDI